MRHKAAFTSCGGKGFHINFPNGLTLSTQFGGGNYSSNYNFPIGKERDMATLDAETVEVAVFNTFDERNSNSSNWRTRELAKAAGLDDPGDTVIGYLSFDDWLKLFDACRTAPRSEE